MYQRFLNDNDYASIITPKHMEQLTDGDTACVIQAEEAAETPVLEHLTEHYEIEKALMVGKSIREHNRMLTYPSGSFFYKDGDIWQVLRTISGYKVPTDIVYWEEYEDVVVGPIEPYLQLNTYYPGDLVSFAGTIYECVVHNGYDFNNIRFPGLTGWEEVEAYGWQANFEYNEWDVVTWGGKFYALVNVEGVDLTQNPHVSNNWGLIGDYNSSYKYEFSDHEYVAYNGKLFVPAMEVNADEVVEGYNIKKNDPRNSNLKKHIARIAVYELHKLITPHNVSQVRITDYEESLRWLRDAAKLRINPQIPRKLDEKGVPITDWQIATFQRDYDPNQNPWQI